MLREHGEAAAAYARGEAYSRTLPKGEAPGRPKQHPAVDDDEDDMDVAVDVKPNEPKPPLGNPMRDARRPGADVAQAIADADDKAEVAAEGKAQKGKKLRGS